MGKVVGIDLGTTFSAIAELDDLETKFCLIQKLEIELLDQQFLGKIV